jgi:hypothetical protein
MEQEKKVQLALVVNRSRKGTDRSSVDLYLESDGSILMFGYDEGPDIQAAFGRDEYECWSRIPAAAVAPLAFALLQERFTGKLTAVHDLRDICRQYEIKIESWSW